jgi:ParB/RepB/Spo0J family partition protein
MIENHQKDLINSFKHYSAKFAELPLEVIEGDANQPRKAFGIRAGGDYDRLLNSILRYGIEDPIKVCEMEEGRYIIMDGHRRFACAKELKFVIVPCRIYPKMNAGEFEARRYEMQNNRREWRPIEKANAVHKIKTEYRNASLKDIADLIGMKQKIISHFEELRNTRLDYLELMVEFDLKESQRMGFIDLLPRLRKIKQYEVDDIVKILLRKMNDRLLNRRSDFIALSKVFSAASFNEEELIYFLTEPKVSVAELHEMTQLSGLSTQLKFLIKELGVKQNLNIKLTDKEHHVFKDLYKLMEKFM